MLEILKEIAAIVSAILNLASAYLNYKAAINNRDKKE